jgi:glycosyltransferase involved in cell wall biosynthesis
MSLKISVITVTYNSGATLEQTIRSVLEQSYPNIEYIIIDGLSTDNTLQIIDKYRSRIAGFVSEKDQGLYDALNKGIARATGDVVALLHSDDFYISHTVIENYAALFTRENPDAVYSDLYYVDKDNTDKIVRKWKSGAYRPGAFINGWMPPHPTFFVKRSVYDQYGTFNPDFKSAADYELMLRLIEKHKIKLSYLPEYTVKMRTGGQSNVTVQNRIHANLEDRKAWEVNGLKPRFYTLYLKPLRKIVQFLR